ncbi:hypothetical protein L7F22_014263 [Adiantum nelumboides]|nr:hypothetical protein [Adiantum nelumboides]MCO5560646.1 hypothetical protein [Adiantum nelumboides]
MKLQKLLVSSYCGSPNSTPSPVRQVHMTTGVPASSSPADPFPPQQHEGSWMMDPQALVQRLHASSMSDRKDRQKFLSMDIPEDVDVAYVFDSYAWEKASSSTKEWMQGSVRPGYCFVVSDLTTLSKHESRTCEAILSNFKEIFPNLVEEDMISSINAFLFACCCFEHDFICFVTGNEKMLRLVAEEPQREELYYVSDRWGKSSQCWYLFIDDKGSLQRANLKWDDPTRPTIEMFKASVL